MPDRLTALDAAFLYLEQPATPMHLGGVAVLRRPRSGFDYDRLAELVERRLVLVPRYRQKIKNVPVHLARPVWVDDADFDIAYHVRRSALPKPGSDAQLHDLVGRLMSRPLDRQRPLWEVYLVEGLARNRIAIITKTHHALVDGVNAMDIGQVLLDVTPTPRATPEDLWLPRPEPGALRLVVDAAGEVVHRPGEVVDNVRTAAMDAASTLRRLGVAVGGLFDALRTAVRAAPGSPLNVPISTQRRFAVARTALEDYKLVRAAHGGTVNDVVLAVVSGALRNWLLSRGEPVTASTTIRAMTPVSVLGGAARPSYGAAGGGALGGGIRPGAGALGRFGGPGPLGRSGLAGGSGLLGGSGPLGVLGLLGGLGRLAGADGLARSNGRPDAAGRVSAYLVDLPVGEPNAVVRLHHVSHAMRAHQDSGQSVGADALVRLGGFAPPTLHALGARVASGFSQRIYNLVMTNAPGPQVPLYAAGARLLEVFAVVPLSRNQGLAIGVTSYDGGVYFGLNADRDAMTDVDGLASMIEESLDELVGTVPR